MPKRWVIYTDGACSNNHNADTRMGAYATVIFTQFNQKTYKKDLRAAVPGATNNQTELLAVIKGIEEVLKYDPSDTPEVEIFSDSQYVVKGVTQWMEGWKKNHWRTKNNQALSNTAMWQTLDSLLQKITYTFSKVKGDGNDHWNDYCDKLARKLCGSKPKRKKDVA